MTTNLYADRGDAYLEALELYLPSQRNSTGSGFWSFYALGATDGHASKSGLR